MSYFPEDIPFMSKEELRENGIRIPKDATDTNVGDTISRQAAIDALDCINGTEEVLRSLPSAQPEPKENWLYDYLVKRLGKPIVDNKEEFHKWFERMVWHVKRCDELSEERRSRQWIPCEERMPEEHEWIGTKKFGTTISDEVYVTFENEKGERFCKHMHFQNGELSRYDKAHMDAWYKGSKPIAWMPLPEPYNPNNK